MAKEPYDPRSVAEKARADLARNDQMGLASPESPAERLPSVTPATFGEETEPGYERQPVDRDDPMPQVP